MPNFGIADEYALFMTFWRSVYASKAMLFIEVVLPDEVSLLSAHLQLLLQYPK